MDFFKFWFLCMALSVISVNLNELRDEDRWLGVLQRVSHLSPSVICLQETHTVSSTDLQLRLSRFVFLCAGSFGSVHSCILRFLNVGRWYLNFMDVLFWLIWLFMVLSFVWFVSMLLIVTRTVVICLSVVSVLLVWVVFLRLIFSVKCRLFMCSGFVVLYLQSVVLGFLNGFLVFVPASRTSANFFFCSGCFRC